jgi:hypothetical protein
MSEFVNSKVMITNSQDNKIILLSNLPKISWIILRQLENVKERVLEAETIMKKAVKDKGEKA